MKIDFLTNSPVHSMPLYFAVKRAAVMKYKENRNVQYFQIFKSGQILIRSGVPGDDPDARKWRDHTFDVDAIYEHCMMFSKFDSDDTFVIEIDGLCTIVGYKIMGGDILEVEISFTSEATEEIDELMGSRHFFDPVPTTEPLQEPRSHEAEAIKYFEEMVVKYDNGEITTDNHPEWLVQMIEQFRGLEKPLLREIKR